MNGEGGGQKRNTCMALYLITIPMVTTIPFDEDNSFMIVQNNIHLSKCDTNDVIYIQ